MSADFKMETSESDFLPATINVVSAKKSIPASLKRLQELLSVCGIRTHYSITEYRQSGNENPVSNLHVLRVENSLMDDHARAILIARIFAQML